MVTCGSGQRLPPSALRHRAGAGLAGLAGRWSLRATCLLFAVSVCLRDQNIHPSVKRVDIAGGHSTAAGERRRRWEGAGRRSVTSATPQKWASPVRRQ